MTSFLGEEGNMEEPDNIMSQEGSPQQPAGCPPMEAFPPRLNTVETSTHSTEPEIKVIQESFEIPEDCDGDRPSKTTSSLDQARNQEELEAKKENDKEVFQVGDHVYQWCSLLGIPGVFQHHGIVIHVENRAPMEGDEEEEQQQLLTIADFSNLLPASNSRPNQTNDEEDEDELEFLQPDGEPQSTQATTTAAPGGSFISGRPLLRSASSASSADAVTTVIASRNGGCLRVYQTNSSSKANKWHKVTYQDHWFHTHLWRRSGTCTPVASDPTEVVMKRVNFLLYQSKVVDNSLLPKYHAIFANCECVAVWCKTGAWSTLQAASFLSHSAVAQIKGTATIAGVAAAQTVTVPAAGMWGWLGYTSTVPLMTAQPLILPAIAAYGVLTIGGPAVCLAVAKKKWSSTTKALNDTFESYCMEISLVT
jgi:hypothetical protein